MTREGSEIPRLGFGTYGRWGDAGIEAMLVALETGYRHLDTAQSYDTEIEVGKAVSRSGLKRDEVFITTKVTTENYGIGQVVPSLEASRERLGVEQIDLTLLHWPSPNEKQPLGEYLGQLVEAQEAGITRLIGVSNFTIAHLKEAERLIGKGRIATDQVELHPFLQNRKLAGFCTETGILVTCYLPIAKATVNDDRTLADIAKRHGATIPQVVLAFELAKGYAAIPTSGNADRIRENFGALKLSLTPDDMTRIEGLDRNGRRTNPAWGPKWD